MMRKFLYAPTFYYSFINMSMNFLPVLVLLIFLERLVPYLSKTSNNVSNQPIVDGQ